MGCLGVAREQYRGNHGVFLRCGASDLEWIDVGPAPQENISGGAVDWRE